MLPSYSEQSLSGAKVLTQISSYFEKPVAEINLLCTFHQKREFLLEVAGRTSIILPGIADRREHYLTILRWFG